MFTIVALLSSAPLLGCVGHVYEVAYRARSTLPLGEAISDEQIKAAVEAIRTTATRFDLVEVYNEEDPNPVPDYAGYRILVMAKTRTGVRYEGGKVEVSISASIAEDASHLRFNVLDLRNGEPAPPATFIERGLSEEISAELPRLSIERTANRFRRDWFSP